MHRWRLQARHVYAIIADTTICKASLPSDKDELLPPQTEASVLHPGGGIQEGCAQHHQQDQAVIKRKARLETKGVVFTHRMLVPNSVISGGFDPQ